ncbi:MAG: acyltransferase domain-containing protein [Atopococcus tabaci]|uniref:Acyltransferase domain-containing protein n=1 Tax=Atopococcus tabaci TaxID=269774 RepID=A0AA43RM00_9LACT|nr:acyltransferase domain-containing protein [Atopococcus tabaci]
MTGKNLASYYIEYIDNLSIEEYTKEVKSLSQFIINDTQIKNIMTYFQKNKGKLTDKISSFFQADYQQEKDFVSIDFELYLLMLVPLHAKYKEQNLSLDIYEASLMDLQWRLETYQKNNNELGLTSEDKMWLARIYHMKIFKLGSLQFEMISREEDVNKIKSGPYERMYVETKDLEELISVHIMYGQDISRKASIESFAQALDFFEKHFPEFDYHYFYCKSWLLYPNNKKFLNKNSKIREFMELFTIVDQEQDVRIPYKYIFYKEPDEVDETDILTSLQRFAVDHPEEMGVGTGLIDKKRVEQYAEKEQ